MRALRLMLVSSMVLASSLVNAKMLKTELEIRSALVGNTLSGDEDGKPYYEYLRSDGKIVGEQDGERYLGQWRISDGRLCMSYEEDGEAAKPDCSKVDFYGCGVLWVDEDGEMSFSTVLTGNPKGL